ncbi:TPA: hypothetical protein ACXEY4_004421, partial [Klebsiella pneumoniae]
AATAMEDLRKRLRFMPEKASFCTGELIRNATSRCVINSAHSRQKRLIIQLLAAEKRVKKTCPAELPVFLLFPTSLNRPQATHPQLAAPIY